MRRLVLVGAGHAHAIVLHHWARHALAGTDLLVVSPEPLAPYSGMVPGWLAGVYRFEEIVIDFPALCQAAGARWVEAALYSVDPCKRQMVLEDGRRIDYDLLSLNLGSTLRPPPTRHAAMLPLRPLALLRRRYEPFIERWSLVGADGVPGGQVAGMTDCQYTTTLQAARHRPLSVCAVGSGPAGFEALLAVLRRLRSLRPDRPVLGHMISQSTAVLTGLAPTAQAAALRALARADVQVQLGQEWSASLDEACDLVLWATGAQAQDWQRDPRRRGSLAVDDGGFVRIDPHLRSISHPSVFAVGDCAHWSAQPLPKAGVIAVRMGPVLARNLRAALATGDPGDASEATPGLASYQPQSRVLSLLATGDGSAIAARGAFAAEGAWAWRWKNSIDRRFLRRFRLPTSAPYANRHATQDRAGAHEGR